MMPLRPAKDSGAAGLNATALPEVWGSPFADLGLGGTDVDPLFVAVLLPLVAFLGYSQIAALVSFIVSEYSGGAGRAVDGNAFATELLRPTINGVVVPTVAITTGTLRATTINVLRNRQAEIRACMNKEACDLGLLRRAVFGMYGTAQHARRRKKALSHLRDYAAVLVRESSSDPDADRLYRRINAMDGDAYHARSVAGKPLEELAGMLHGVEGATVSREFSVSNAASLVQSLNVHRSNRIASLFSTFPTIHWLVLMLLSVSIVVLFLIDSNQDVLQYLNNLQLRFAFSIIISVFSSAGLLCYDLADPYRGATSVKASAQQLIDLERTLESDVQQADRTVRQDSLRRWRQRAVVVRHSPPGTISRRRQATCSPST